MITNNMDYHCHHHFRVGLRPVVFTLFLLLLTGTANFSSGQSVSAHLQMEVATTSEFGRVLSIRTMLSNKTNQNIFLTNFLGALEIERLNDMNQFENYFDTWFVTLRYDSSRSAIENNIGIAAVSHNNAYDGPFSNELYHFNHDTKNMSDSALLRKWCIVQAERIETIQARGKFEFQTNINSLPPGTYRLRYTYKSENNGVSVLPDEAFKGFKIPQVLFGFSRWTKRIESEYLHLTIN